MKPISRTEFDTLLAHGPTQEELCLMLEHLLERIKSLERSEHTHDEE